jgi:hypothetical protein
MKGKRREKARLLSQELGEAELGDERLNRRLGILADAAVAVAFTVGVAAAQTYSFRIRSAAQEITGRSAASISSLSRDARPAEGPGSPDRRLRR